MPRSRPPHTGIPAGATRSPVTPGDTRWPLALNVVVHWGIGLPVAWILAFRFGLGAPGLWYGLTAGLFIIAASLIARFTILTRRDIARV